jgi:hypothetical protein
MHGLTRLISLALLLTLAGFTVGTTSHAQILPRTNPTLQAPNSSSPGPDEMLIGIIKSAQKFHIKESWGDRASECFTDLDLERFHNSRVVNGIAVSLRQDEKFIAAVEALRALPLARRAEILDQASFIYKPTWAQLGRIDRSGQTDAGQRAEKEIAEAIVGLARELLKSAQ